MNDEINPIKIDTVIVDGKEFNINDSNLVKDCFDDKEYIHLRYSNYTGVYTCDSIDERGMKIISSFTKISTKKLFKASFSYSFTYPDYKEKVFFRNKEEFESFCEKYEFIYGKNTDSYYNVNFIKYDRQKPVHFNYTKSILSDSFLERNNIFLNKNSIKTKEYKELKDHFKKLNVSQGMDSYTFMSFEGLPYTFGVEMETVSGVFRSSKDIESIKKLNFQSVHDGSLRDEDKSGPWGGEYVTGVLKGDAGLAHLHKITDVLNSRCTVDKRTSVHVHIGSLNWNSEDIVYAYLLGRMLEEEIFSMMPKSRMNNEYCKLLPDIDPHMIQRFNKPYSKDEYKKIIELLYNKVFYVVSKGRKSSKKFNKNTMHPEGQHGGWDRASDHRYSWLNFTNIIFNQRGSLNNKTIEFRCHSGTLSYRKIHNWIKICMAIVEFVNIGKKDIIKSHLNGTKISLNYIISKIYPKTGRRLNEYISLRKQLFSMGLANESVDYIKEDSNIKNIKDIVCV